MAKENHRKQEAKNDKERMICTNKSYQLMETLKKTRRHSEAEKVK